MKKIFFYAVFILVLIPGFSISDMGILNAAPDDEVQEDFDSREEQSEDYVVDETIDDSIDDSFSFSNEDDGSKEDKDTNETGESDSSGEEDEDSDE